MPLDSSIPKHLRCPRTRTRRVSDQWKPPLPAYSSRGDQSIETLVMGYFGVQSKGDESVKLANVAFRNILDSFAHLHGPGRYDSVHYIDGQGYLNKIAVAYWTDPDAYEKWNDSPAVSQWWLSDDRLGDGVGYFREVFRPRIEQFETIFTHEHGPFEGVSGLLGEMSDPIIEHGYWGSMRDRFPLAQTDDMDASGDLTIVQGNPSLGGRVIISGHQNLTLIRSGEDWSKTEGEERRAWFEEMQPVLIEGMNDLRDNGLDLGCYCNRYVYHMDENGSLQEKGFGYSLWRSLTHLEQWAETHPAHLNLFVMYYRLAKKFNDFTHYHEVSVFDASAQNYEYINCHRKTGLLGAV